MPAAGPPSPGSGAGPAYLTDGNGILRPGVVLGKYQIVKPLGSGGMGSVYEAVHTGIGKAVALKTMSAALANDPRAEQRFLREAAAASRLEHPHVVDVTDFGADNGVIYIVMELMRGEDLAALIQRAPAGLDFSFVADVMLPVCAGVFAAHEKGVIHRDLKPQNIFLARTALGDVVPKVLDFGISKLVDDPASSSLTNSGSVMGTTHYLSPEQVTGLAIDGRSDEFALGVMLYECLTGRRPHDGDTIFTIMRAISEGRFARPLALRPDLPPPFEAVVLRAMSNRADDRFPTVHALGRALLPFASPKGRVMWVEYFDRSARPGANSATHPAGNYGSPHGPPHGAPQWPSTIAVPGMMPGPAHLPAGDTRSGSMRPVSVMGTNEMFQRRGSAAKKAALLVLAVGAAGVIWMATSQRPALDQVKQTVQDGVSAVRPASPPVEATPPPAPAPTTTPAPPKTTPPPTAAGSAVAGSTEASSRVAPESDREPAETAPSASKRPTPATSNSAAAETRSKKAVSTRVLREPEPPRGPLLPKARPSVAKPAPKKPQPLDVPMPPRQRSVPRDDADDSTRTRQMNPGTSPILD